MAVGFPRRIPSHSTKGERKTYRFLLENLGDTSVVYFEPNIRGKKPDLLVVDEDIGILVLEVKDYLISNLDRVDETEWVFTNGDSAVSPLLQARRYSFEVCNFLRKDSELCDDKGKLRFNYSHGVVFTNITRMEFISHGLDEIYPSHLVLLKDDLDSLDGETLFETLYGMKPYSNKDKVTPDLRDRIRYILFPEVRVRSSIRYKEGNLRKFHDLVSMDLYQETLARDINEGHRLIRGVAGSGKTLILVARAKLLHDKEPTSKILIVCYNVTLKAFIRGLLGKDYKGIQVETFNEFMTTKYQLVHLEDIDRVNDLLDQEIIYRMVYDHILVDEAQDMEPSWISFLFQSLREEKSTFLLCMDNAQNIFRRSLVSTMGIDFRGRSTVLSSNYRNPKIVIEFAWNYYSFYEDPSKNPDIISPKFISRTKGDIRVRHFTTYDEELGNLIETLKSFKTYVGVGIIYRVSRLKENYLGRLLRKLEESGIPYSWVSEDKASKSKYVQGKDRVNILTVESSKGLNFETVFMPAFTSVHPGVIKDTGRHASLSYIGLTRSTKSLYVSYHEDNELATGLVGSLTMV